MSYFTNSSPGEYIPTVYDNKTENIKVDDQTVNISFWDTVSSQDFYFMRALSYANADVIIFCISLVDPRTLNEIIYSFVPEVDAHCKTAKRILVGLKLDLRDDMLNNPELRKKYSAQGFVPVTASEGEELKKKIGALYYIECSSHKLININGPIEAAARAILNTPPPKTEKTGFFGKLFSRSKKSDEDKKDLNDKKEAPKEIPPPPPDSKKSKPVDSSTNIEELLLKQKQEYEQKISDQKKNFEVELAQKISDQKNKFEAELAQKISDQKKNFEVELAQKISDQKNKFEVELAQKISDQKNKFEVELAAKTEGLKRINHDQAQVIKKLNEENKNLRSKVAPKAASVNQNQSIKILDEDAINNFEKIEKIGDGGGGKVYKVFKKVLYALKVMRVDSESFENMKNFFNEYEIMNILNHPNILKTFGIFMSSANKPPSILLEYCPENLDSFIKQKKFSNVQLLFSIYQIVEGMKYVHFRKIIHRDLKPTNILIAEDGSIKICDFGISKLMTSEVQTMTRGVGSQKFMAPEIINEEVTYDEKVDVYSFGVLIYFMLSGGQMPVIKMVDLLTGKKAEIPSDFTRCARDLINDCWSFGASERPSFKEIHNRMAKNDYMLLPVTKNEIDDLNSLIKQHKLKIPSYEE